VDRPGAYFTCYWYGALLYTRPEKIAFKGTLIRSEKQKGRNIMKVNYLKLFAITAMILGAGMPVYASIAAPTIINQVPGRIMWIDVKLGKMEIKLNQSPSAGETKDYRITRYETRVKDTADRKFLTIDDLRPGENVTLDVVNGQEDKIIAKIVAESLEAADFQEASGQLQAIDGQAGTLTLQENMRNGTQEQSNLSYFLFDPNNVVVLLSPSIQPVALVLKPGDEVKIQFIIKDGKQQAYSITLYSPQHTTTTTVTTTTNSQ